MNLKDLPPNADADSPPASPQVFQQLGLITRQLHDALNQLGVMPKLQRSADGLSDARSRLNYIARKTGEAAEKVLTAVDEAKQEQGRISDATGRLVQLCSVSNSGAGFDRIAIGAAVAEVNAAVARTDDILTDIMLAQDFHDLTGQVVAKVVTLALELEDGLVKLLVQAAPGDTPVRVESAALAGPVVDGAGRTDVVTNQGEVDDLLASLGF